MKIAVLISGRGTNLQALIDACAAKDFPAEIALVISNKSSAYGLERAKAADIPTQVVDHTAYSDRPAFEAALNSVLEAARVELVCLAGFMRLLNPDFVNRWKDRLINIHPSLLPSYKGLHTHERALEDGVRFTGCTVHFVRAEMDQGPIIAQSVVSILPGDTPDTLADRVLEEENRLYPKVVRLIAEKRLRISGGRVQIDRDPAPNSCVSSL